MSDNWATPQTFVDWIEEEFDLNFNLDACASAINFKAIPYYDENDNSLQRTWRGTVWCNPPYSHPLKTQFINKAIEECMNGNCERVVMLLPARTDTKIFHSAIKNMASSIYFISGRLNFELNGRSNTSSAFASMLVIFTKEKLANNPYAQKREAKMHFLQVPSQIRRGFR